MTACVTGYVALDIRAALDSRLRSCASENSPNGSGTTPHSIRFYERQGLLPAAVRTDNGYREYGDADAERLRLLIGLRQLDLPLEQAAALATMCAAGRCDQVSEELRAAIDAKRQEFS